MTKFKKQLTTNAGKDLGERECSLTVRGAAGGITNFCSHSGNLWRTFKNPKINLPYDSSLPILSICPKEPICYFVDTCTAMLTATPFTIARKWKQFICPSTTEWIIKLVYIHYGILDICKEK